MLYVDASCLQPVKWADLKATYLPKELPVKKKKTGLVKTTTDSQGKQAAALHFKKQLRR